jgi:predicted PolB exonuclease-like 3'-5' exonuclease
MKICLDIETIPTQRTDVIQAIRAQVDREIEAKADAIRQQYKKAETIEAHLRELNERSANLFDEAYRRTALDGGFGEVLIIGWALDDEPAQSLCRRIDESEADLLREFSRRLPAQTNTALHWIGHNIVGFDLRFLWQRYVVNGITPGVPSDEREGLVNDTMLEWAGRYSRDRWVSLDQLCSIFGIASPKGKLDGSQVWDFAQAGRYEEIAEYCRRDVETARTVWYRLTKPANETVGINSVRE